MKKHFTRIVAYLVACFCIIQFSANGAQIKFFLTEKEPFSKPVIKIPISNNNTPVASILESAIEVTDEEQETCIQQDHYHDNSLLKNATQSGHCQYVKTRIKSQEFTVLDHSQPPLFILYHSWKSNLS
ncbi:MAG: hypothetical protein EB101_09030 [Chitinophagia bacterium]|nr:hypothetical protein [Chitinophagia bacterium]